MDKIKKYRYPIIISTLCLITLLSFQHCGKDGGSSSGTSNGTSTTSSAIVTSPFAPDSYFVEYKNFGGTTDSVIIGFLMNSDNQFSGYKVRFLNGNYNTGFYQLSKGSYQFTSQNKLNVTYVKDTCNDLTPEQFEISGTAGDFAYLKQDGVAIKFLSEKKWLPSANFINNNSALVEDVQCNKF